MSRADNRHRMSLEALAHIHLSGDALAPDFILLGPTFADTLALNRPGLDLYEDAPEVRRIA